MKLQSALVFAPLMLCGALSCGGSTPPSPSPVQGEAPPAAAPPHGLGVAKGTRPPLEPTLTERRGAKSEPAVAVEPLSEPGPRIAAIGLHAWIMPKPRHEGLALGNVRLGTSVRLREPNAVSRHGCPGGWYAVEPRGYVCLDPVRTTLDIGDPFFRALSELAPDEDAVLPFRYAYSRGAPMYSRVPTPEEWARAEQRFGRPGTYQQLGDWAKGHEELLEPDRPIEATDPVPWFFEGGRRHVGDPTRSTEALVWRTIPNGSMLAFARAFEMHGRVWLVTPDLMVVPADRVQRIRRSSFRGVALGGDVTLPIAWNRRLQARPLYVKDGEAFVASGETIEPKGWRMIEEGSERYRGDTYYRVRGASLYLRGKDSTVSWPRKELPRAIQPGEKWIDARITPGTLTAYVGLAPVYATLFSPGKGGHPVDGLDHTKYATTQVGYFRFEWKERVATMSNEKGEPKVLWFSDVPHIQYVKAPLAMHVAYWHEDFSNPKSAECLNLSPEDGRFLFGFTDPPLPEGWGAVRPGGGNGSSTPIVINGL